MSPEDKKYLLSIESAIDSEDLASLRKISSAASSSTNTEIRAAIVDGLSWFGEEALIELTPFMADADEDVAEAARSAWELALSELKSPKEKLNTALMALETITDRDSLTTIGSLFANVATELIDGTDNDEKAKERRSEIVLAVENMINNGKASNSEVARDIFEDITGHEYISREETKLYLNDPENYESPEDREEMSQVDNSNHSENNTSRRSTRTSRRKSGRASSNTETPSIVEELDVENSGDNLEEIPENDVEEENGENYDEEDVGDDEGIEDEELGENAPDK